MADSDPVALADLDVIARYSLAVRAETADRAELAAVLRADLAWLEGTRRASSASAPSASAPSARRSAARPSPRPGPSTERLRSARKA